MDKNKIIAIVVIVAVAVLAFVMIGGGDQYSKATTEQECKECKPQGKWYGTITCVKDGLSRGCTPVHRNEMSQENCEEKCGEDYKLVEDYCAAPEEE